ncbi:MAG: glycosyltransferase [Verrucomicrobia bacterium]|nr:glycosyltransferase [Verrucomicrobiota bacterium]
MTNRTCDISLVICTRNRATQLAQTLKRVLAIRSRLAWELIVADNGSTDRTSAVVQEFTTACDRPVRLILKSGRGVSYARNAGWQTARSDIIAYIDDDCYPAEDYLDAVFDCFLKDPRLGFVGGRILLHDPRDRKITIQESLERRFFAPDSFIAPGVIQGANLAFRQATLEEVGGFDPWFGAGALFTGEEAELLARISAAGWTGAYDPAPLVYHHHGRKTASAERRLAWSYDRGRGAYYAKCILNNGMRQVYIRNWLLTRRYHSWRTSAFEIASGLEYIARALISGRIFESVTDRTLATYRK